MRMIVWLTVLAFSIIKSHAGVYYVSLSGSDELGDGSASRPWRSLMYTANNVEALHGHTIKVGPGVFIESGLIELPLGVSLEGSGIDVTTFKAAASFYYHPSADPGYSTDKFLLSLSEVNPTDANQMLRNFTIDGDAKHLHGGIYVRYRNNVSISQVKIQNTNYCGIWYWDVKDSQIADTQLLNCSWGSSGYSSGALNLGNLNHVEISRLSVDENMGYGIKAIGPDGYNDIFYLNIHDCRVSVAPFGLWNNGTAPNISIELWQSTLVGCEIYNNYVDNTISLVNSAVPPTGIQTIRVHDNTLDMSTRANGAGYGLELSVHDAEVDHNYFIEGSYGIANWTNPMHNWLIHHNVFYALAEPHIGEVVRSQWSGLHNVKLYNNTIEFTGDDTMNVIGLYGGSSDSLDIKNNLVINSTTGYSFYPNQLIHTENGATIISNGLQVLHNSTSNLDPGALITSLLGLPIPNPLINLGILSNPSIVKSGSRPTPYYNPAAGSSLINAGLYVGLPYSGSAPDIGAYEIVPIVLTNQLPLVSIVCPALDADYPAGSTVFVSANASDVDGKIVKVEFFNGATKLGEANTIPFQISWSNPPLGKAVLTAKATDNQNGVTTSNAVPLTITSGELLDYSGNTITFGLFAPDATLTDGMTLTPDATASKGCYFSMPSGSGKNNLVPPPSLAVFDFQLPAAGNFEIWVRVRSPENHEQYFIDGGSSWSTWDAGVHPTWAWVKVLNNATGLAIQYPFNDGFNTLTMGWADDDVDVDRIILTTDAAFVPTDSPAGEEPMLIYPNPAADEFIIQCASDFFQQGEVRLYDLTSRLTKQLFVDVTVGTNEIPVDVSDLSATVYIVSLRLSSGQHSSAKVAVVH